MTSWSRNILATEDASGVLDSSGVCSVAVNYRAFPDAGTVAKDVTGWPSAHTLEHWAPPELRCAGLLFESYVAWARVREQASP